ncbi:f3.1 [Tranosema rostrale ichnovirus]|nr:f3.1 [Tranosema rostrale ichnovirus]
MNSRKYKTCLVSPRPPVLTSKEIVLPVDVILHMAEFLCLEDFRSFVRALWPNNDEDDMIRKKLWRSSTWNATTTFLNEKKIEIKYNYDPWRTEKNRILISVDCLLPIFGGIAPAMDEFTSVSELCNFVTRYVHLNMCSDYQHASCSCHLVKNNGRGSEIIVGPSVDTCHKGHFHHYCSQHVVKWLNRYLANSIRLRETVRFDDEKNAEFILMFVHQLSFSRNGRAA